MVTTLTIPGKVKAKERPRRGRWGNFYTPKPTQDYEAFVCLSARRSGLKPLDKQQYIGIDIKFFGKYGNSDIDNLIKSVLDGFKDFFNDNKVTRISAEKLPSEEYYTQVKIIHIK